MRASRNAYFAPLTILCLLLLLCIPNLPIAASHPAPPLGSDAPVALHNSTSAEVHQYQHQQQGEEEELSCIFDKLLERRARSTSGQSPLAETTLTSPATSHSSNNDSPTTATGVKRLSRAVVSPRELPSGYAALRISVMTADLDVDDCYCTAVGQQRSDYMGGTVTCDADSIFTEEKRAMLKERIIPRAVRMHAERLFVRSLASIHVTDMASTTTTAECSSFHHPAPLPYTVYDSDFILYIAAAPIASASVVAWATPCRYNAEDGRPVLGVANVSPRQLAHNPEKMVRAVVHEMMHALGFAADVFQARGMMVSVASVRGKANVPALASPRVVRKGGDFFNCPGVGAVEVEDTGSSSTAGSHWKMRILKDELMCGYAGVMMYSSLSIAAMEDTGFYKGDYAKAEDMVFGRNAGCSFLTESCIDKTNGKSLYPTMFCDTIDPTPRCATDRLGMGTCAIQVYGSPLPQWAAYFANPSLGGAVAPMDYCPYVPVSTDGSCVSGNEGVMPGSLITDTSRCLSAAPQLGLEVVAGAMAATTTVAGVCVEIACFGATRAFQLRVKGSSLFSACTPGTYFAPANVSPSVFSTGALLCPTYAEVCLGNTLQDATAADEASSSAAAASGNGPSFPPTADPTTSPSSNSANDDDGDGKSSWTALDSFDANYTAFTCHRDGVSWTQFNHCRDTSDNGTTCIAEDFTLVDVSAYSTGLTAYNPCSLSRCVGWYCEGSQYALVQHPAIHHEHDTTALTTALPCLCAPLNATTGKPNGAGVSPASSQDQLRVLPDAPAYRRDDPVCLSAGFACPNAGSHLQRHKSRCFCCPHRDQPGYRLSYIQCAVAARK